MRTFVKREVEPNLIRWGQDRLVGRETWLAAGKQGIRTSAVREGDEWVINGSKTFITNGITADLVIVACRTDPGAGSRGFSLIVVEDGTPGFSRGRKLEKLGLHAQDTGELFFTDCRVPYENLLGTEGEGLRQLFRMLPRERMSIAITGVAGARAAIEWTVEHVKNRTAFGQPIASPPSTAAPRRS